MIKFNQKFKQDIQQIRLHGEPYAFVRCADGELAFCERRPLTNCDNWHYDGSDNELAKAVTRVVTEDVPGLYLGISCPCCDPYAHKWYMDHAGMPLERITYSNIFVNANHRAALEMFRSLSPEDTCLVACKQGDITVPENAVDPIWDYSDALEKLFKVRKPILVAAGPIKCGLIYDYWTQVPEQNRQIIVDIGSMLDPMIHGKCTRNYHRPNSATHKKICRWSS